MTDEYDVEPKPLVIRAARMVGRMLGFCLGITILLLIGGGVVLISGSAFALMAKAVGIEVTHSFGTIVMALVSGIVCITVGRWLSQAVTTHAS